MTYSVHHGDCLPWLRSLEPGSVDLVMCSPPYEKARLYLENGEDMQIARTTEAWVDWLVEICHAMRTACKGLCVLVVEGQTKDYAYSGGPLLLAAELLRQGFCLRKPPIYRRVGIPGSGGTDWLRNDYEFCICFTRGGKLPWSDNTAMGHPPKWETGGPMSYRLSDGSRTRRKSAGTSKGGLALANPGNVITETYTAAEVTKFIGEPTDIVDCTVGGGQMGSPLASENEAPFPETLAEFFVRSFCPPGGLVCDPFCGSGTTGAVAVRWRRNFIGCDLRQSQVDLALRRIREETPMFEGMA